ncbi:MAG: hypothetical protein GTO03_13340, partial [Planctomycetales bacterium]|nr:hypothetical protein [Planctomycetales bacterium]
AVTHMTRGQLARYEAETASDPAAVQAVAGEQLRQAAGKLDQLDQQLRGRLVAAHRRSSDPPERMSAAGLQLLVRDVQRQRARCLLNQALCFAADTPDRTSALTQATARFEELAQATDPIDWPSRLGQLECYRVAERREDYQEAWDRYRPAAPAAVGALFQQESARWQLARGNPAQAWAILQQRPALSDEVAAEWDFLALEVLLALRPQAGGAQRGVWEARVSRQLQRIEAEHGPFWERRAAARWARQLATTPDGGQFPLLIRAAQAYYRAGQVDEALVTYDRARQAALESSSTAEAFQAGLAAAAIVHQRQQHAAARDRFAALAAQLPHHPQAAEADWLAIFHQAQQLQTGLPDQGPRYVQMLDEHLRRWPQGPTADKARWWLGQFHQAHHRWEDALAAYRQIAPTDPRFAEALEALAECYGRRLGEFTDREQPARRRLVREGIRFLEGVHQAAAAANAEVAQLALVEAAGLRVYGLSDEWGVAERQLREVLDQPPTPPPGWLPRARLMLAYTWAAQGKPTKQARQQLAQAADASEAQLAELGDALAEMIRQGRGPQRAALAELQLELLALRGQPAVARSAAAAKSMAVARAEALAAAGRRGAALDAYATLAQQDAADGPLQEAYAQLLMEGRDQADWEAALRQWRNVQRQSRPASPRWFRAKHAQALAHHRLGNSAQAERIIKLTEVLHPELG